jgi:tripartite-type tricarboxylate transporter receptor subunit TctC
MKRCFAGVLLAVALCGLAGEAPAQASLTRIIVPAAAGGAPDVVARIIAGPLSAKLGQTVVVENRAGAGERLGAELVARAAPRRARW